MVVKNKKAGDSASSSKSSRSSGRIATGDDKARKQPEMYHNQLKHFLACVAGATECASPGTEAIKAVAVAEATLLAGPGGTARKVAW